MRFLFSKFAIGITFYSFLSLSSTHNSVLAFALPSPSTYTATTSVKSLGPHRRAPLSKMAVQNTATALRAGGSSAAAADPAAKNKKIRVSAFDSMRFFLIFAIVLGHFVSFANPSAKLLEACSQHNVFVGAFFALSGYVTAYTTTENAQRLPSPKLIETPKQKWILSRVFGYYPLHLLICAIFSPMFLYTDVYYSGWPTAVWHAILSITMTQAWFPMHAEVWNAPTWFLSALTFCTAILPFSLPSMAKMTKPQLRKTAFWLGLINVLPKLGYAYDLNAWSVVEGITSPKKHPSIIAFNLLRFTPLFNVAEVLLGAVCARLVMLDKAVDEEDTPTSPLSTALPLALLLGVSAIRVFLPFTVSDMLVRSLFFVPLFLNLLMATHRNTAAGIKDPIVSILSNKVLTTLGGMAFPIFIVHGPIGQMFFKKLIANKIFGQVMRGPANFGIYMLTLLVTSWILTKTFLPSKAVKNWSKKTVDDWSKFM